jgi:hypothetical protein
MRKSFAIATTLCFGLIASAGNSRAANEKEDKKLTLAVYGDWPYSTDLLSKAPLLIGSINSDPDVSLVLHIGDIHSGSMLCTADWNQGIFNLFQQFEDPFVYTPGDNEWTDCHRPKKAVMILWGSWRTSGPCSSRVRGSRLGRSRSACLVRANCFLLAHRPTASMWKT